MGKGSTKNLLVNILRTLSNKPKSITEISKETGLDRISISQYLKILNESGFIIEEKIGKNKKYFISCNHSLRENTFFNLFIDEKTNELIDSLYHLIQKKWLEISKKKLLKTTAQKIMYDVIKDCNLKIPNGWYIYGGICVKPFDSNKDYNYRGVLNNVKNCVNETVLEYSKNNFEYESKQLQYKKSGKELYDVKEEILKLLYSKNFSKNSMYVFQKLFSKFWRLTSLLDRFCDDILNDFDTLLIDITKEWDNFINEDNEMNFSGFKQKLISSFETIWKMVAMINFKNDLFNNGFYSKNELDEHFKLKLNLIKEDIIEINSEINEMIVFEDNKDNLYEKFVDLIKENSKLSKEEKDNAVKEFENL